MAIFIGLSFREVLFVKRRTRELRRVKVGVRNSEYFGLAPFSHANASLVPFYSDY